MQIGSKEHYEMMESFEKSVYGRFDKEPREIWKEGRIYQDGQINELFKMFSLGYSAGRLAYLHN